MRNIQKKVLSHKDLIVWQKSMDLVSGVYKITKKFPDDERFGLTSQMRRSAVSIPSNIAEGRVRRTTKDYIHFLHVALGSSVELDTQLDIALRENFIQNVDYNEISPLIGEVSRMLSGLISSLNAKR